MKTLVKTLESLNLTSRLQRLKDTRKEKYRSTNKRPLRVEKLENRELLAVTMSISDATATEDAAWFHYGEGFVKDPSGGVSTAYGVVVGPDADLYVTQLGFGGVKRFDGQTGDFIDVFADGSSVASQASQVVFHGNYLFVATGDTGVLRFDATTGAPVPAVGKPGASFATPAEQGVTNGVHGLDFGSDGHLYITSNTTHQVLKYDGASGQFISVFVAAGSGGLVNANALDFGPDGHLYVASSGNSSVLRYQGPQESNPGAFIDVFVPSGSGGLSWIPTGGLQFRTDGDIYISNRDASSILRFDGSTGAFRETVIAPGQGGLNSARGFSFDETGRLYVVSYNTNDVKRFVRANEAVFTLKLSAPSAVPITVNYSTSDTVPLSAQSNIDYVTSSGTITFVPGQTTRTVFVQTLDDASNESTETFTVILSNPVGVTITDGTGVGSILDNDPFTKFYVVNDASTDWTYEYGTTGAPIENYALSSGNTTPRGAASTAAGDKVWVADANRRIYVYNTNGGHLGNWTAGLLPSTAQLEGIATNGTDVWIVDNKADRVYRYANAASALSGTVNAASSFSLNIGNKNPKDIVTDGTHLWVVNDSTTDKVFKYTTAGVYVGSWTITTPGVTSPTGITLDPTNVSHLWIVDNGTDKVYQYNAAAGLASGSKSADSNWALASGNTNPQGIADPPPPAMLASNALFSKAEKPNRKILTSSDPFIAQVDSIFENWNEDSVFSQTKKRLAGRR